MFALFYLILLRGELAAAEAPLIPSVTPIVDRSEDEDGLACGSAANDCALRSGINQVNAAGSGSYVITFASHISTVTLGATLPEITQDNVMIQVVFGGQMVAVASRRGIFRIVGNNVTTEDLVIYPDSYLAFSLHYDAIDRLRDFKTQTFALYN